AAAGGHSVTFVDANPETAEKTAAGVHTWGKDGAQVSVGSLGEVQLGDVVVLAVWYGTNIELARQLGKKLAGKVVVDCMNPIGRTDQGIGLTLGHTSSGAEVVQGWLPRARVVKTLNQVGAEIMADTSVLPRRPVMVMAGDDDAAKAMAAQLLADLGFEPMDAGDLRKARYLEPFAMVWINQAIFRGKGRDWAFAAVSAT
ncbi:MAG: NAD(P)-binding domain-containing protein, partial [Anaerolineae bacterium]|nr:NAD(P)-binding domain-containing protein [Anaerolineae bacterium]